MTSQDYWQQRAEQNALRVYRYSQRRAQLVTRWFGRASREMQQRVNAFYRVYAESEGISLQAAKATLTDRRAVSLTRAEFERLATLYPNDPIIQRLLRQASLQRAISREEFLRMQLQLLASELYGETSGEIHRTLTETFEDAYYHGLYDYQQFVGYGSSFNRISTHQIEAAVTTKWSGKNYSDRLWGDHRVSLARYLDRIITTGFAEGRSGAQMGAELQKAMDLSAYNARRLIRTESAQVANRANLLAYQEFGTPQFQFLATLDFKTSELCQGMDGKVFDVKDGKVGVNLPPLHPFCRSTTVPYLFDPEFDQDETRAARGKDGRTYQVPASMTYKEWHKQHVEADPEWMLAETKLQHGRADAAQYAAYRDRLGKGALKSFDAYQQTKYTDADGWDTLKRQYRRANWQARSGKSAGQSAAPNDGKPQLLGTLAEVTESSAIETLAGYRSELAGLDHEVNISITANGQIWRTEGTAGAVHPEQVEAEGVSLVGSYSLHNHPASETYYSLSEYDVGFFFGHGERYSEAFDHIYRYHMQRTAETPAMTYDEAKDLFRKIYQEHAHQLSWEGKIDIDEDGYHVTMIELAKRLKFEYGRETL